MDNLETQESEEQEASLEQGDGVGESEETPEPTEDQESEEAESAEESEESEISEESEEGLIDDEALYLRKFGFLPEGVDSFDKAMGLLEEKLTSAEKPAVEAREKSEPTQPQDEGQAETFMSTADCLNDFVKQRRLSEEQAEYLAPLADAFDVKFDSFGRLMKPFLEQLHGRIAKLEGTNQTLIESKTQADYDTYVKDIKGTAPVENKAKLDEFMKANPGIKSYWQAHFAMIGTDSKAALNFLKKLNADASKKDRKFNFKSIRAKGGKGSAPASFNAADYILPSGEIDRDKLDKLSGKARVKAWKAIEDHISG